MDIFIISVEGISSFGIMAGIVYLIILSAKKEPNKKKAWVVLAVSSLLFCVSLALIPETTPNEQETGQADEVMVKADMEEELETAEMTPNTTVPSDPKAIYDNAINKPAIDIYNELASLGYTVVLKHAGSKQDFTEVVSWTSDPSDTESYMQWLITGVESFNAKSKTASFFINTLENIDAAQNQYIMVESLQAKLDVT